MDTYPGMPAPRYLDRPGVRMAVYEQGPANGLPVILCHGFPELAYSWRHQLPALADAGFRAIAPDQRGYGRTGGPDDIDAYDIHHLTGDLIALLDAEGIEQAVFVGHDWGGLIVWQVPLLHPGRAAGIVGINTPFIPRLRSDPIQRMRDKLGEDFYIVFFQEPGAAEAVLEADVARYLRFLMRTGAPEPKPERTSSLRSLPEALALPEEHWPGRPVMPAEELQVFVDMFERTGFTGALNWYRNYSRNWETTAHLEQKVTVPGLMIMAEHDQALPPSMAEGMERYVPDLEKSLIENCGHWTQQEHPQAVNGLMIDWLKRRFG